MEEKNDPPPPQQQTPPSPSFLPSHDVVFNVLFGQHRDRGSMYKLYARLYATMVDQCRVPDMEEIRKAIQDVDTDKATAILNNLVTQHTASGDLHRINAEIYSRAAAECDDPSRKDLLLKNAVASATRSVELAPSDIDNHCLLVYVLSQAARDEEGRRLLVQKSREALQLIDNSNDQDQRQSSISARTKIFRIMNAQARDWKRRIDSVWVSTINQHYIRVPVTDLGIYYRYLKDESAVNTAIEAWSFGQSHRSWKFWMCCCCDQKFKRSVLLFEHFADTHLTPQAKRIICTGVLEHGNPSSPSEGFPVQETVSANFDKLWLFVSPSCLLNVSVDTSETALPSRDLSITPHSYRPKLNQWTGLIDSRRRQGTGLHFAVKKKSELTITDDGQATTMEVGRSIGEAFERLSGDIDSEIKRNGEWILLTEDGTDDLKITENPFGEYDYRDVLLPLAQSYICAWMEEQADKEATERSDRISPGEEQANKDDQASPMEVQADKEASERSDGTSSKEVQADKEASARSDGAASMEVQVDKEAPGRYDGAASMEVQVDKEASERSDGAASMEES